MANKLQCLSCEAKGGLLAIQSIKYWDSYGFYATNCVPSINDNECSA